MIDLYYWPTPNGWKITIMLEECGLDYTIQPVNIGMGEQFAAEFLAISPNNRMPAIVDHDGPDGGPVSVFESGAILLYLAEKTGRFAPSDARGRIQVLEWLFWQIGGLGPMMGQLSHFKNYAQGEHSYALDRYAKECNRLFGVMDRRLADNAFLAGDYSIADMASYPWVLPYERFGLPMEDFPHLRRWFDTLKDRPAVRAGIDAARQLRDANAGREEEARRILFGQTAASVAEAAEEATQEAAGQARERG